MHLKPHKSSNITFWKVFKFHSEFLSLYDYSLALSQYWVCFGMFPLVRWIPCISLMLVQLAGQMRGTPFSIISSIEIAGYLTFMQDLK